LHWPGVCHARIHAHQVPLNLIGAKIKNCPPCIWTEALSFKQVRYQLLGPVRSPTSGLVACLLSSACDTPNRRLLWPPRSSPRRHLLIGSSSATAARGTLVAPARYWGWSFGLDAEDRKMTIFYERGSPEEVITPRDAKEALDLVFEKLGKRCGFRGRPQKRDGANPPPRQKSSSAKHVPRETVRQGVGRGGT